MNARTNGELTPLHMAAECTKAPMQRIRDTVELLLKVHVVEWWKRIRFVGAWRRCERYISYWRNAENDRHAKASRLAWAVQLIYYFETRDEVDRVFARVLLMHAPDILRVNWKEHLCNVFWWRLLYVFNCFQFIRLKCICMMCLFVSTFNAVATNGFCDLLGLCSHNDWNHCFRTVVRWEDFIEADDRQESV